MNRLAITVAMRGGVARAALLGACVLAAAPAPAQTPTETPAGTRIANTAVLSSDGGSIPSNTVTLSVDERVDVAIVATVRSIDVDGGTAIVPVGFDVTDVGNADGSFAVAGATDDAAVTIVGIASDDDGNGVYDPAVDKALAAPTIALKAGARRRIFVLVRGAGRATRDVAVTATATAGKGHGPAGTILPGAGVAGVDAVIGRTGASATASTLLVPGAAGPRLEKSQSVVAPDGSARVMPGSIVTYRLDARFPGAATAVEASDAIPEGTVFVPGSITLDGRAMTDTGDDDAAAFDGRTMRVALGDIAAAATRTVVFRAMIR